MTEKNWIWALGIEDTFIGEPNPLYGKTLDEYELIDHYRRWEQDITLLARTGVSAIRWGIPWYRAEQKRGRFDFSWSERVIDHMLACGVEPILDLVHYGTPCWMNGSFLHPDFPKYVQEYTQAVLHVFGDRVSLYTPNNEPYTAALFCGVKGQWPPYRKDYASFAQIMVQIAKGSILCSKDIRAAGKKSVHVEVASDCFTSDPALADITAWYAALQRLYWDLILGKVDRTHELYNWLIESGISEKNLSAMELETAPVDIMGLNFYPQWSISELTGDTAEWVCRPYEVASTEFSALVKTYWDCYQIPIMITETSVKGSETLKCDWLDASTKVLRTLMVDAVEIVGYTWFPAIDMIDWEYQVQPGKAAAFPIHLGIWNSERTNTVDNPVEKRYKELIRGEGEHDSCE